jgi:hypothetical protein
MKAGLLEHIHHVAGVHLTWKPVHKIFQTICSHIIIIIIITTTTTIIIITIIVINNVKLTIIKGAHDEARDLH